MQNSRQKIKKIEDLKFIQVQSKVVDYTNLINSKLKNTKIKKIIYSNYLKNALVNGREINQD